ncbi:hypothetical protein [Marinomonas sp. 2405UD68-3]|uniref:hypothetical protein n=1 Tax=Marinomonas sp. 2405UD68-3 TaxID=3391835 RepID=UPI0039C8D164
MKRIIPLIICSLLSFSTAIYGNSEDFIDYLFVDLKIDDRQISGEIELITRDYINFYLPIEQFNHYLSCNLILNTEDGRLSGNFWKEEIDILLEDGFFFEESGDKYISINTLKLFSIDFNLNHPKQWLNITTNDRHPKTKEIITQQRKKLIQVINERNSSLLVKENEYQLFTPPNIDVNLSLQNQDNFGYQMYSQLTQDALYHQANIKVSKNDGDNYRGEAILSRKLRSNGIPMTYNFGDMSLSQSVFSEVGSKGLGFYFGQDNRSSQKLQENVSGYALPGTEAALFLDDFLVNFTRVGSDGYYEFNDLNLKNDKSTYRIVFTHPDGTKEVREISQPNWQGLRADQWTPEFIFIDFSKGFLNSSTVKSEKKFAMANATYVYNEHTLLRGGTEWSYNGQEHNLLPFTDLEWRNTKDSSFTAKLGYSDQLLYEAKYNTKINNHSLHIKKDQRGVETQLINSNLIGYEYTGDKFKFGTTYFESSNSGLNVNERGVETKLGYSSNNHSHYFNWRHQITGAGADKASLISSYSSTLGSLNVSISRTFLEKHSDQVTLSYNSFWRGYHLSSSIRHTTENKDTTTNYRLSKSLDNLTIGASISHKSNGDLFANLNLSLSLNSSAPLKTLRNSSYTRGSVIKHWAFLDENYNGTWEEEPILEGVKLTAQQQNPKEIKIKNKSHLIGINSYEPTIFYVDAESLDNPFLLPMYPRVKLESHPGGVLDVALPFHKMFEVEGEVFLFNQLGEKKNHTGYIPLEIISLNTNKEDFKKVHTEQDGFFIIDKLQSGIYRLKVSEQYLKNNDLDCSGCDQIIDTLLAEDHIFFSEPITLTPGKPKQAQAKS